MGKGRRWRRHRRYDVKMINIKICVVYNDDIMIQANHYTIGYTPARCGGWFDLPPEIHLTIYFDEIPPILHRIAMSAMIIEELKIYPENSMPVIILGYVKIIQEETYSYGEGKVFMDALRVTEHGGYNKIIDRKCECGHGINFWYVVNIMSFNWKLSPKVISDIWNNDLVIFKCCRCFKKDTTAGVIL